MFDELAAANKELADANRRLAVSNAELASSLQDNSFVEYHRTIAETQKQWISRFDNWYKGDTRRSRIQVFLLAGWLFATLYPTEIRNFIETLPALFGGR